MLLKLSGVYRVKLDRISCTNYFMSIHNLRYSLQLIKIATRNKQIFEKKFTILALQTTLCASQLRLPSWPLRSLHCDANAFVSAWSRDLDKSNSLGRCKN